VPSLLLLLLLLIIIILAVTANFVITLIVASGLDSWNALSSSTLLGYTRLGGCTSRTGVVVGSTKNACLVEIGT